MTGQPEAIPFWDALFEARLDRALAAVTTMSRDQLMASSERVLVDAVVNDHAAGPIVVNYAQVRLSTSETPQVRDVSGDPTALWLILTLPCCGAARLLTTRSFQVASQSFGADGHFEIIKTTKVERDVEHDQRSFTDWIAAERETWFRQVAYATEAANALIVEQRIELQHRVTSAIRKRRGPLVMVAAAASQLDIPLNAERTQQLTVPLHPRTLNMAMVEASAAAGGNESGLAADIADALINLVESFGRALERMPATANRLAAANEEAIRDVLLFVLNANWQGAVTGETFLGEGKTDIHLRWRDRDAFIGECKFWHGEKGFTEGLDQLLGRYTVWRATRVAVLLFIRDRVDISAVITKAVATVTGHPRFVGQTQPDNPDRHTFMMRAQHDAQKIVTLTLLPVVIPPPAAF